MDEVTEGPKVRIIAAVWKVDQPLAIRIATVAEAYFGTLSKSCHYSLRVQ
jgi:hypothetical protein